MSNSISPYAGLTANEHYGLDGGAEPQLDPTPLTWDKDAPSG